MRYVTHQLSTRTNNKGRINLFRTAFKGSFLMSSSESFFKRPPVRPCSPSSLQSASCKPADASFLIFFVQGLSQDWWTSPVHSRQAQSQLPVPAARRSRRTALRCIREYGDQGWLGRELPNGRGNCWSDDGGKRRCFAILEAGPPSGPPRRCRTACRARRWPSFKPGGGPSTRGALDPTLRPGTSPPSTPKR
jgi:hypothetical protein